MPNVTKQTVTRPLVKAKAGSVLSEATDIADLVSTWLKVIIYGENRVGKTYLACKFPKPLLLLALEPNETGGSITVRKEKGVKHLRLKTIDKIPMLVKELQGGAVCDLPDPLYNGKPYATIVVDSATSLQDIILQKILGLDNPLDLNSFGAVSREQYFERSDKTRENLRLLLNLPMHTIITAKQKDHNRQDKTKPKMLGGLELESFFGVNLGVETAGWLQDNCDYICRLYIEKEVKEVKRKMIVNGKEQESTQLQETGKLVRRLQTDYHPNYAGGFRSDTPGAVPQFIENPTFEKFMQVVRGEKIG